MFVLLVGVVGVLGAMPTGINSAELVVFQDSALHLSASKFSEFRRDRVNPAVDLRDGSSYMSTRQEPTNSSGWRDFARGPGEPYEFFADVERYEWKVDQERLVAVGAGAGAPAVTPPVLAPMHNAGAPLNLTRVTLLIHQKGTSREFVFTEYMYPMGRTSATDPTW